MSLTGSILLRDVELDGRRMDVRVDGGRVVAIGPDLRFERRDEVVDGGGGALLPGLHDHHIHLLALAAAARSVVVGPPRVRDRRALEAALRTADARLPAGSWLRAVGYHDSVAGPLDRWVLDQLVPGRPVRVQHRSGALWVLSSPAVDATHLDDARDLPGVERSGDGVPTGRVWRLDAWLRDRVPQEPVDLASVGELVLRRGVTGVTDATPMEDSAAIRLLATAVDRGDLPQHVVVTGGPCLDDEVAPDLSRGPVKLLLPDHELPDLEAFLAAVRLARAHGRAVAVHCVTAVAAVLTLAALEEVGARPGDRIEHGAVLPLELLARLADFGITIVTNPGFVAERGDSYLAEVDAADLPDLWRCRSLLEAGLAVAAGTDAPFGDPDPWAAMAAAVDRQTEAGRPLGPDESVAPATALGLFLSPLEDPGAGPRTVTLGAPADLCLLADPLAHVLGALRSTEVAATVVSGVLKRW
ncbi:MAG: amidohydrolase family protein [Acidimicrobiales bacterium]